jgi:hypothetical protein
MEFERMIEEVIKPVYLIDIHSVYMLALILSVIFYQYIILM